MSSSEKNFTNVQLITFFLQLRDVSLRVGSFQLTKEFLAIRGVFKGKRLPQDAMNPSVEEFHVERKLPGSVLSSLTQLLSTCCMHMSTTEW